MANYKDIKYQFPASAITSGDIASARLNNAPAETKPVVSSVSPTVITNDAQNIVITGTDFVAIPRVDVINTATGIWYSVNTVTRDSATQLTVNLALAVDAGTYRIRVENPDGNSGISAASFLTVSDAPVWTTSAGSLGSVAGDFSGTVTTVAASSDSSITFSETMEADAWPSAQACIDCPNSVTRPPLTLRETSIVEPHNGLLTDVVASGFNKGSVAPICAASLKTSLL